MDIFLGSIMSFAFPRAPVDWALCNGQQITISQYEALYVVLGTIYGGDGVNNFLLPNLLGRMPMGQGQGTGLTPRNIGQTVGSEAFTLQSMHIPAHTHAATSSISVTTNIKLANPPTGAVASPSPANSWLGASDPNGPGAANIFASDAGNSSAKQKGITNTLTGDISLTATGAPSPQPLALGNPTLALNFCIALNGIFPSQG